MAGLRRQEGEKTSSRHRLTCDPFCCARSTCPRCAGDGGGPRPEPRRGTPTWGTETRNASAQPLAAAMHPAQPATQHPETRGGPATADSKGPQAHPQAPQEPRAWAAPAHPPTASSCPGSPAGKGGQQAEPDEKGGGSWTKAVGATGGPAGRKLHQGPAGGQD